MANSKTTVTVDSLLAASKDSSASCDFATVTLKAIKKAWPSMATGDHQARALHIDVPAFQGAQNTHNGLAKWQQNILRLALVHLTAHGGEDDLRVVFGLLMRGATVCHAGKVWAFYAIVARCMPAPSDVVSDPLEAARARILAAAGEFLDDEKDAAFQTYFMEPTEMYMLAKRSGDPNWLVHGANIYLATLAAALGVRFSREPFLGDQSKGVAPFLEAKFKNGALEALQRPENLGKSWAAVRECKDPQVEGGEKTDCRWIRMGGSAVDSAKLALGSDSKARQTLQPYLEAFASAFTEERLLPRLFSRLIQVDANTAALNEELAALHREGLRADADDDGSEDDVRHFVWDLESQPPAFRLARAALLFRRIGITK